MRTHHMQPYGCMSSHAKRGDQTGAEEELSALVTEEPALGHFLVMALVEAHPHGLFLFSRMGWLDFGLGGGIDRCGLLRGRRRRGFGKSDLGFRGFCFHRGRFGFGRSLFGLAGFGGFGSFDFAAALGRFALRLFALRLFALRLGHGPSFGKR